MTIHFAVVRTEQGVNFVQYVQLIGVDVHFSDKFGGLLCTVCRAMVHICIIPLQYKLTSDCHSCHDCAM